MIIDQDIKISVFGNFDDINPTTENVQFFLDNYNQKGFLPSIFQEVILTGKVEQVNPLQRIALVRSDGLRQVSISTKRLDFDAKVKDEKKVSLEEALDINSEASDVIDSIFKRFSKKSNRIALNTTSILVDLSEEDINDFMSKFSNPISIYKGHLDEWSTRMMIVMDSPVGEKANIITNVQKTKINRINKDETRVVDGFLVSCDINTIPQIELHFEGGDVKTFIAYALKYWDRILEEMK